MPDPHKIALVLDPSFGEQLFKLADQIHVWIIQSDINKAAFDKYTAFNKTKEHTLESGATIFQNTELTSGLLDTIILHHGELSHQPPLSKITVIGLPPDKPTLAFFAEYGFDFISSTNNGFILSC